MENKKKFSVLKFIRNILIILLILYVLTIIYKALIMSYIYLRIEKTREFNSYDYKHYSMYDFHKVGGTIQKVSASYQTEFVSSTDTFQVISTYDNSNNSFYTLWTNTDPENKYTYVSGVTNMLENEKPYASYQIGFSRERSSPYELSNRAIKDNYSFSFILNPFKTIKIDLDFKDFIFESYLKKGDVDNECYNSIIIRMDMKTGLINRRQEYVLDKLVSEDVFYDYSFDNVDNITEADSGITEEMKQSIIKTADELNPQEEQSPIANIN